MLLPILRLLVAAVLVLVLGLSMASADTVLVQGQPQLTQEVVNDVSDFFEWVLEAPMTGFQRQQMQQSLVDSWNRQDKGDIQTTQDIIKLRRDLSQVSEGDRAIVRLQLQGDILAALRQQPSDPMAQTLVGLYDAAHTPIAQGTPPLTRQVSDAHAEVLFFMLNEVAGSKVFVLTKEVQDDWAKQLAAAYGTYRPAEQEQMAQLPLQAAALRVAWPSLPDDQRAALRDQWRAQLADLLPPNPAAQAQVQAQPQPAAPAANCSPNDVLCRALADSNAYTASLQPFRQRVDQMSCDDLMALSNEDKGLITPSQNLRLIGCYDQKEAEADAQFPPAERAQRQLARSQQNSAVFSNIMTMQHETSTTIINNVGNPGYRYEYRPVP